MAGIVRRSSLVGIETFKMLIGGQALDARSGRTFTSLNPYTGQGWAVIPDAGAADVDAAVAAARAALDGVWGRSTGFARAARMRRLGDLCSRTPTSLRRPTGWSPACSRRPGRPAWPVRG